MKKKIVFVSIIFIFILVSVWGATQEKAENLFYEGNLRYKQERFDEAVLAYEKARATGFESGPLYYNLGNAYFKQGSLGKAVCNYLRAQKLMGRDADLHSNLSYAQSLVEGGVVSPQRNWISRFLYAVARSFTLDGITVLVEVLYLFLVASLIIYILTKRGRRMLVYSMSAVFVLLIFSVVVWWACFQMTVVWQEAVIIVSHAEAKFEPFDDATTFFTLDEGEKVFILSERVGWKKIERSDGKEGWLRKTALEEL